MLKDCKIAVLMGGVGSERKVSLLSGENVVEALRGEGLDAIGVDITPEKLDILDEKSVDVFFLALHGIWGEDGQIQKILEDKNVVYTGSDSAACRDAFDKIKSLELFRRAGVRTAAAYRVESEADARRLEAKLDSPSGKYVAKPVYDGSSVGVEIRTGKQAAIRSAVERLDKFGTMMIEDYIPGRELTVGIANDITLPILEILPQAGFYDYNAKYISDDTQYGFNTIGDKQLAERIANDARLCYEAVGARDAARVDFILGMDNTPYVLEINTTPGFTSHSLVPKAAVSMGISPGQFYAGIIEKALVRNNRL